MKRILLTLLSICLFSIADAQIAKWLIEPAYAEMYMANGADAIMTESDGNIILWSFNGKKLIETTYNISDFKENLSVLTTPGSTTIMGIITTDGGIMSLQNCGVTYSYPYYSCGKLLVQNEGRYYRFVGRDGSLCNGRYTKAYPYFNGYASCQTYKNIEKQKDSYLLLVNEDEEMVQFSYKGKNFDTDDVEFIDLWVILQGDIPLNLQSFSILYHLKHLDAKNAVYNCSMGHFAG